jgi:monofunctional biosynthetic peptidoglycan transglycosylase
MQLDPEQIDWQIINDGVMGGRSRSSFTLDREGLHFRGTLSTAFGGGFASIRGRLPRPLGSFPGFRLDLKGDGRRYQLRLRESPDSNDIAWRAFFDTSGSWETISLSIGDFEPVIRGRRIVALPGLSDRTVRYIGFMLTGDKEGRFDLSIRSMATLEAKGGHA